MVLDLELFREDKGGNPAAVRDNQTRRFKDVALVDVVVQQDQHWRHLRHLADTWNRLKNVCSKEVGERLKRKESPGPEQPELPDELVQKLSDLTVDALKPLTVNQIKKVSKTFYLTISYYFIHRFILQLCRLLHCTYWSMYSYVSTYFYCKKIVFF